MTNRFDIAMLLIVSTLLEILDVCRADYDSLLVRLAEVSTLLEILGTFYAYMTPVGVIKFQPFLRFWAARRVAEALNTIWDFVSTLLEILGRRLGAVAIHTDARFQPFLRFWILSRSAWSSAISTQFQPFLRFWLNDRLWKRCSLRHDVSTLLEILAN